MTSLLAADADARLCRHDRNQSGRHQGHHCVLPEQSDDRIPEPVPRSTKAFLGSVLITSVTSVRHKLLGGSLTQSKLWVAHRPQDGRASSSRRPTG
jgi:hypothetical protein